MSIFTRTPPYVPISFSSVASILLTRAPMSPTAVAFVVCHLMVEVPGSWAGVRTCVNVSAMRLSICCEVSLTLLSAYLF